jgi:hypothetical protein
MNTAPESGLAEARLARRGRGSGRGSSVTEKRSAVASSLSSIVPMNRATVAASGSTLAAIASAAAPDEGEKLPMSEASSEASSDRDSRLEALSFFLGARRRFFPRRFFFGSPPRDGTSVPPSAARAGADAPRAASLTTPRRPPAPLNPGDEARTGRRAALRATAVGGFGARWTDPDATGANARASVTIAREEERSASPASGLRVRARRDVSERALVR